MSDFTLKKGDRLPVLRSNLSDSNGYVNISGATVSFVYQGRKRGSQPTTGSATILSGPSGLVEYNWASGDVTTPGMYYGEWRVIMPNEKQISFPNDGFIVFEIVDNLNYSD
jgi:hypothetical protein